MSLHQLIQVLDRDPFGVLAHQAENQLDGAILLGKFSTVRHDCSLLPPFFSQYLRWGTRGLKLFPGNDRRRVDGPVDLTVAFRTADYKAVNPVMPV
jgi:hypothetical protein